MKFKIDKYEKYTIVAIGEEKVNSTVAPEIKSEFLNLAQDGVLSVIVNMEGVKYIDSSGLSALLVGNRTFSERGVFVIFKVTDHVMKLINISQLDKVMNIVENQEEAADVVLMSEIRKNADSDEQMI
ncbi:MAG: STAS domain-containing protein [Ekhidna sp.]|nr:STAS domain-containing protein [Ekhidna sp.]MBC6426443.1 STAS domain-containing protein [Ekhidna sp.]